MLTRGVQVRISPLRRSLRWDLDRQTGTQTSIQKDIITDRKTYRKTDTQKYRKAYRIYSSQIHKETGRERIGSQTVIQTERQAYRKTDKQRERNRQIYRQSKR